MTTRTFLQKIGSTKLWCAAAGIAAGVALALGADADSISKVSGAVTAVISVISYIFTEGMVDARAIK